MNFSKFIGADSEDSSAECCKTYLTSGQLGNGFCASDVHWWFSGVKTCAIILSVRITTEGGFQDKGDNFVSELNIKANQC